MDTRIVKTKAKLIEALSALTQERSVEEISVSELCKKAGVNRTTFYKYYGSQHDLMADIQADFLAELENSLRETEHPLSLLMILTYIGTHRETCIVLMNNALNDGFLERILSLSLLTQKLENQISPDYTDADREYVKDFVIFGAYAVIRKWLLSEQPEPPEQITDLILAMFEKI